MSGQERPRVVIVGAGFGGLACARALRSEPVQVTIVDRHNYTAFTPFPYQVATALLEASEVAQPVRRVLHSLVAIQSGRHAAGVILASLHGRAPEPFRYRDLGTMATQGRDTAVAQIGPVKLSGTLGWLAWLLVHIARIAGVRTRLQVMANWAAGYLVTDRPVRLIAGPDRRPDDHDTEA